MTTVDNDIIIRVEYYFSSRGVRRSRGMHASPLVLAGAALPVLRQVGMDGAMGLRRCELTCSSTLRFGLWPRGPPSASGAAGRLVNVPQIEALIAQYSSHALVMLPSLDHPSDPPTSPRRSHIAWSWSWWRTERNATAPAAMGLAADRAGAVAHAVRSVDVLLLPHGPHLTLVPLVGGPHTIVIELLTGYQDDRHCHRATALGGWLTTAGHLPLIAVDRSAGGSHEGSRYSWRTSRATVAREQPVQVNWRLANHPLPHCHLDERHCHARRAEAHHSPDVLVDVHRLRSAIERAIGLRCGCAPGVEYNALRHGSRAPANATHSCHAHRRVRRNTLATSRADFDATPHTFLCCNSTCNCPGCHEACPPSRAHSCPLHQSLPAGTRSTSVSVESLELDPGPGRRRRPTPLRRPWDAHHGMGCDRR